MQFLRFRRNPLEFAAFFVIIAALMLPRLAALGRFVTPDEPLWLFRSASFYNALAQGDWASTYKVGHPGVTVMWAGAAAFWSAYPEYRNTRISILNPRQFDVYMQRVSGAISRLEILVFSRLIMVLAHTLVLALAYLYARRLVGLLPAFAGFLLIAFDPFHLALTRILHTDGLYSGLVFLSVLAYLRYADSRRKLDLIISATAAGLGWLTKSPAFLLLPVIGLLASIDMGKSLARRQEKTVIQIVWLSARPVLVWLVIGVGVFVIAWPAMWVEPGFVLARIFTLAQQFSESGHESALFFNGSILSSGDIGLSYFYFYPLTYLWRATPTSLGGLVLAIFFLLQKRAPFDGQGSRQVVLALALLILIFTVGLTLPSKKFDRYYLPVYAPLDLIACLGWVGLMAFLKERLPLGMARWTQALPLLTAVGVQVACALTTFPYYFTYYNPLMGGSAQAPEVMQIGWGEGLDEAARYLNTKPDATHLQVVTWYATGCFSYYFRGHEQDFWSPVETPPKEWDAFLKADYAVVYISQVQRGLSRQALDYLSQRQPEHTIWLNGIEYARIYDLQ